MYRTAVLQPVKMLRNARTSSSVEPHYGADTCVESPLWAGTRSVSGTNECPLQSTDRRNTLSGLLSWGLVLQGLA